MEAWRDRARPRPNLKEVRESLAFFEKVRRVLGRRRLVVDAAGGHGAVALAFAAAGRAERAVVADVRCPPSFERLRSAWLPLSAASGSASHEAVDVGHGPWLRGLLEREGVAPSEAAVVSVHACGVVTDTIIDSCIHAGVDFAVMPCCHGRGRDPLHQTLRDAAGTLGVPLAVATDLARLGAITARGYRAKVRRVDPDITPENTILIGLKADEEAGEEAAAGQGRVLGALSEQWRQFESRNRRGLQLSVGAARPPARGGESSGRPRARHEASEAGQARPGASPAAASSAAPPRAAERPAGCAEGAACDAELPAGTSWLRRPGLPAGALPTGALPAGILPPELTGAEETGAPRGGGGDREVRLPDGSYFKGQFLGNRMHGFGKFVWASGGGYEGQFDNDKMHGEGAYCWGDGSRYSGQWVGNSMGPRGTMAWTDGGKYTGEFRDGLKHGDGELWWPDGRSYRGQWDSGAQHGVGYVVNKDGVRRKSQWDNGKMTRWLEQGAATGH